MPLSYTRHVPKFLQGHAHLLGRGAAARDEEPVQLDAVQPPQPGSDSEDEQVQSQCTAWAADAHKEQGACDLYRPGPCMLTWCRLGAELRSEAAA